MPKRIAERSRLRTFSDQEAIGFLLKRTRQKDEAGAARVAAALDNLPLALKQAAAFIDETEESLNGYLEVFQEHEVEMLAQGEVRDYSAADREAATVATTWLTSIHKIRAVRPAAGDLLTLLSFMAADEVPFDMIEKGADLVPKPLSAAMADSLERVQTIGMLLRYSLITRDGDEVSVHRLVQAVTRSHLSEEDLRL
jgi:hypothetical protein